MSTIGNEIESLIKDIEQTVLILRQNQEDALGVCAGLMQKISGLMIELLQEKDTLQSLEQNKDELELGEILQYLQNLNEAFINRDIVWLADVLQYEIWSTLQFFREECRM